MFDELNFSQKMPDGFISKGVYQTYINCSSVCYYISDEGKLGISLMSWMTPSSAFPEMIDLSERVGIFDTDEKGKPHEYSLHFKHGYLVAIDCYQTGKTYSFNVNNDPVFVEINRTEDF